MTWQENLKQAGVSIHVIATGGGANIIQMLWEIPGSSDYLSGFSFPYAQEEQIELLGFTPDHYCSEEAAVDLASAAYMKAYRFGGKKPVGIGLTASVASEHEHRGDHRVYCCIITDEIVRTHHYILEKDHGYEARQFDGEACDNLAFYMLCDALGLKDNIQCMSAIDATELAMTRFFMRPFFHANGTRDNGLLPLQNALMSGAFNPPHEGHFGMEASYKVETGRDTIYEITVDPPHKNALTVQDMLKRAKLLQGHNCIFCQGVPLYFDKIKRFAGQPILMGADAALRLLDPKWGVNLDQFLCYIQMHNTTIYVAERVVDGKLITASDLHTQCIKNSHHGWSPFVPLKGHWDVSSTEVRDKLRK
jgi:hypothetical protein